jgi:hypothetical protein
MRNLLSILLLVFLAAPALAQSDDVKLDRFSLNLSPEMNAFQSPQYLFGHVKFNFTKDVTLVEVAVKMRDGTGKAIGGNSVTKGWASASAGQDLEFDYSYFNPSAVQSFQPVLVITAKGPDGKHIHKVFKPDTSQKNKNPLGY